jgi:uncharacterized membrane protein YkvA (DUF1232 family)
MRWLNRARQWAKAIKRDVVALWIAARDPRTPVMAKVVAGAIAAYALSPIDLIPDFIPVLGYLDDLVIVPLGIMLAVSLVPEGLNARVPRASQRALGAADQQGWPLGGHRPLDCRSAGACLAGLAAVKPEITAEKPCPCGRQGLWTIGLATAEALAGGKSLL